MCGIAGILNPPCTVPADELMRGMLGMIRHRGPDQFGVYLGDRVALGHARLSILDLKTGQQPIGNEDQTLWIVCNGEVFNYIELRRNLEARGHLFTTTTDTEVILHLYEEYGPDCLNRLNGQFAIAIWDEKDRSLFLARDRLGVRPLFYTQLEGTLVFGSEIKAILAHPQVQAELDPVALDQVFTYWSTLSPRTCFRGIVELPPGHYMVAKGGRLRVSPYWRIGFPEEGERAEQGEGRPIESYVEELRALLVDATRIRLRADVPVGAYLSGGLDSSTIATIIRALGGNRIDTFSIAFADFQFDESEHQRRMARFLGTEHQVVLATHEDIGSVFPDVIWHTETPIMRTAPAPMFLLSKLVRDRGYKVVLTGEGADEFLAGYDIFKEAKVRRFWAKQPDSMWRPLLLKRLYPDVSHLGASGADFLKAFFGNGLTDVDRPDYSHTVRWQNNRRTCRFFSEDLKNKVALEQGQTNGRPSLPPDMPRWDPLARAQYCEISIFLSQYLLSSQGDRPAMAHSVEGRFPFLDYRVVDVCNRLPARLKLRALTEKYLLRRVAECWLPPEIVRRPKRPYRAPIHRSFFHARTPDYVRELLGETGLKANGLFNPSAVAHLVAKLNDGKTRGETDDMALVGMLSMQLMNRLFVESLRARMPLAAEDDVKVVDRRCLREQVDGGCVDG